MVREILRLAMVFLYTRIKLLVMILQYEMKKGGFYHEVNIFGSDP
jgi:hypothetical protein